MVPLITLNGIDQAISSLNYSNHNALKSKLLNFIRQTYTDESSVERIGGISPNELIKLLWDTGDDSDSIKNKAKNFNCIKSTLNADLKRRYREGKNPEGIIIGPDNTFVMSEEAKDNVLEKYGFDLKSEGDLSIDQMMNLLKMANDIISGSMLAQDAENSDGLERLDQLKGLLQGLSEKLDSVASPSIPSAEDSIGDKSTPGESEEIKGKGRIAKSDDSEKMDNIQTGDTLEADSAQDSKADHQDGGDSVGDDFLNPNEKEAGQSADSEPAGAAAIDDSMAEGGEALDAIETNDFEGIEKAEGIEQDEAADKIEVDELDEEDLSEEIESDDLDEDEVVEEIETDDTDEDEIVDEIETDGIGEDETVEELETGDADEDEIIDEIKGDDLDEDEVIEEIEVDDTDEDEIIDEIEGDGLDEDEVIEELEVDDTDEDEIIDEIESDDLDEDEVVDEIEVDDTDEDEIIDEIEGDGLDEDEVIEELEVDDTDEDEIIDEIEGDGLDEDEVIEELEVDDTDEDEIIDEIEGDDLDEDEVVDEIEVDDTDEDEIIDAIETDDLDEDEAVEEMQAADDVGLPIDSLGQEYSKEESGKIKESRLLAEEFDGFLGAMDRYFNHYVLISEGTYTIGGNRSNNYQIPEKRVRLAPFYIGRFPITNGLFEIFVEKTGYKTFAEKIGYGTVYYGRFQKEIDPSTGLISSTWNASLHCDTVEGACWYQPSGLGSTLHNKRAHPVVQVTIEDAMAFAAWTGKRLPTEEEWEAASRTAKGWIYPWGQAWQKDSCNIEDSSIGNTTPVDQYVQYENDFGLSDTMGNVLEWTWNNSTDIFKKERSVRYHVAKGGSWISGNDIELPNRFKLEPESHSNILGFRCVAY